MARVLRMPAASEIRSREVRSFVELLFELYRQARRPPLRRISAEAERSSADGTASTETIRRMLRGITIPSNWGTVEAVLLGLCSLAGRDPDEQYDSDSHMSLKEEVEWRWNQALDHGGERLSPAQADPWAGTSYPDDPPF
jgi:hypothetical protein